MKSIFVAILFILSTTVCAEEFNLKTLDDNSIHIVDYEGNFLFTDKAYEKQPLFFFFFGVRCPFCEKEIPQVISLVKKRKIKAIGIQAQFPVDDRTLQNFIKSRKFNFEVLKSRDGNRLVKYLMKRSMWVGGVPYYVWVDKYGNLEPIDLNVIMEK